MNQPAQDQIRASMDRARRTREAAQTAATQAAAEAAAAAQGEPVVPAVDEP